MNALHKIKAAGFTLNLVGDSFQVTPASALSDTQRALLKQHKAEIIQELRQQQSANDVHDPFFDDDRHHCHECQHLNYLGRCTASPTRYHPVDTHPRRCADFFSQHTDTKG